MTLPVFRRYLLILFSLLLCAAGVVAAESNRQEEGTITIGGNRDYPPYEFLDAQGVPAGYNVDLSNAIAQVMGMKVAFHFGSWAEIRADLAGNKIDVLQGISYSEERSHELDFSPPHAIIHHAIFARSDARPIATLMELHGRKVAVFKEGIMYDTLRTMGFGGDLIATATPADALRSVAAGESDYAVLAILPGIYLIRELHLSNLTVVNHNIAAQKYGYAVKKGNGELLSRFSEGLAILRKTGQYQAIYDKWLGVEEPPRVAWEKIVRYGAMILIPLLLILAGTVLWSRTLQRRVTSRTRELASEVLERKRALEELQRHQDKLIQADKMASLGILVSGVAHEINNPNALILLNTPILQAAFADGLEILEDYYRLHGDFSLGGLPYSRMKFEVPRLSAEVLDAARRIRRIVDDLRDFSRGDDAAIATLFDLNPVVEAGLRLVDQTLRQATSRLEVDLAPDLPQLCGSPQSCEQVVINLILNACQALSDRDGAIAVTTRLDPEREQLLLEVRDEGVGIPEEHLTHLTDPFFTTKRERGGTGLGLAICAGIIEKHGGTLDFFSDPATGTIVRVAFPLPPREFAP